MHDSVRCECHRVTRAGKKAEITVVRTNLDGVPRAGRGSWRIVRLEQPASAALPAPSTWARKAACIPVVNVERNADGAPGDTFIATNSVA